MELTDILKPEAVKVLSAASSKKRLFQEIGDLAQNAYELGAATTVEALLERENLGPTGVGHGVALPHARLPNLDGITGIFVMLEKPIDFGSIDRLPVDIAFALFAPENAGVEHLKALALVSRTLREPTLCSKLRANLEATTLYAILTETRSIQAA
jgi:nitrogen PTS system EIIA component